MEKNQLDHQIYKRLPESEADGCAWVFADNNKLEKYYFKHPELKSYEVRIRIISTGLCFSDSKTGRGKWSNPQYPLCTGHEAAGEIIEMGEDVKSFKLFQKVMIGPFRNSCEKCESCLQKMENYCTNMEFGERKLYAKYWGGHSTHVHIHYKYAYLIPDNLDIASIPPLMCAGITTFLPLFAHAKKGDKIAIIGCGGLGHFGLQWGVKLGCETDVFASNHLKDDMIKKLGGKNIIVWTEGEHLSLQNEYDIILNTLPCELSRQDITDFMQVLKPKGKFIQVGLCDRGKYLEVDPGSLVIKGISFIGSDVGGSQDYVNMLKFVAEHGIESICEIFGWDEFIEAFDKLENGKPIFRCVINVDEVSKNFKLKI